MTIKPGIILSNGETYYPPSRLYILAFALRGFQWAIDIAEEKGFRESLIMDLHHTGFIDGAGI